jgi:hypothetical protein
MAPSRKYLGMPLWFWMVVIPSVMAVVVMLAAFAFVVLKRPAFAKRHTETVPWGQEASFDTVHVKVGSVSVGHLGGWGPLGFVETTSDTLNISLSIRNTDPTKNAVVTAASRSAVLQDSFGNRLQPTRIHLELTGQDQKVPGQIPDVIGKGVVVRSDQPVSDMLPFAIPVPAAGDLILSVNAEPYGGKGTIKFEIPKNQWKP